MAEVRWFPGCCPPDFIAMHHDFALGVSNETLTEGIRDHHTCTRNMDMCPPELASQNYLTKTQIHPGIGKGSQLPFNKAMH